MFTPKQFEELDKIWDGTFSTESQSICSSCGACCHNTEKTLFPKEYDFLVAKTGQMNTSWKSIGCLCYALGNKVKPIICKVFPLQFKVDVLGNVTLEKDFTTSTYSAKCEELTLDDANYAKAKKYLEFLFSDIHNRIWYLMSLQVVDAEEVDAEYLEQLGKTDLSDIDRYRRALLISFGFDLKEFEEFWKF